MGVLNGLLFVILLPIAIAGIVVVGFIGAVTLASIVEALKRILGIAKE